jgi:hypothetical protein
MNQISNEIVGGIHAIISIVIAQIIGVIIFALGGTVLMGLFSSVPIVASLVGIIVGIVSLLIAVFISAQIIKKQFSYTDVNKVVSVATMVVAIISIVMSLGALMTLAVLYTIISIALTTFVFHIASRSML